MDAMSYKKGFMDGWRFAGSSLQGSVPKESEAETSFAARVTMDISYGGVRDAVDKLAKAEASLHASRSPREPIPEEVLRKAVQEAGKQADPDLGTGTNAG